MTGDAKDQFSTHANLALAGRFPRVPNDNEYRGIGQTGDRKLSILLMVNLA